MEVDAADRVLDTEDDGCTPRSVLKRRHSVDSVDSVDGLFDATQQVSPTGTTAIIEGSKHKKNKTLQLDVVSHSQSQNCSQKSKNIVDPATLDAVISAVAFGSGSVSNAATVITPPVPPENNLGSTNNVVIPANVLDELLQSNSLLQQRVDQLTASMFALSSEVSLLKSLFGVGDRSLHDAAVLSTSTSNIQIQQQSAAIGAPSTDQSSRPTFADVARRAPDATIALQRPLRQALLTAVYEEDRQKKSRERNFIMTGLPVDALLTDTQFVKNLCHYELGIDADVVRCDRIGNPVSGKVQPVKVAVRSAVQAAQIISSAKLLRRSKNQFISEKVFINADMTKAQSLAAYEDRCRRRQSTNRRTVHHNNLTSIALQPDNDRSTSAAAQAGQQQSTSSGSQLN